MSCRSRRVELVSRRRDMVCEVVVEEVFLCQPSGID